MKRSTPHLEQYTFSLPPELIATIPAEPRDSARLFVYETASDRVTFDTFQNLSAHLPVRALMVLNDTKVVPARATLYKETGGKVRGLFLINEYRSGDATLTALFDRAVSPGASLYLNNARRAEDEIRVVEQRDNLFVVRPSGGVPEFLKTLYTVGVTPIPPYLKDVPLSEEKLRARYQSAFAEKEASVAAPTASLHFTPRVFEGLERRGINQTYLTLHVGMGTFAPVRPEHMKEKRLHKEYYEISRETAFAIRESKEKGRPLIAAGTTVTRALESSAEAILNGEAVSGETELFILPPFPFRLTDVLITNFHVPRSSLMCLVDAFLQHKGAKRSILDLYALAIQERFRFFSFGDAMVIL